MKNILLIAALLSVSGLASAKIPNCNKRTTVEVLYKEYRHFNFVERDVPQGTCDFLGLLKGKTVIDCREAAETNGYQCFQVTEFREGSRIDGHITERNCFACL